MPTGGTLYGGAPSPYLALPVIPDIKITDKGLVDVTTFKIVPLFGDA
jgi:hypothetical protein